MATPVFDGATEAEIKRMFIIPEMRGRHLGHLMLTHLKYKMILNLKKLTPRNKRKIQLSLSGLTIHESEGHLTL